jgi:hypothetical protein
MVTSPRALSGSSSSSTQHLQVSRFLTVKWKTKKILQQKLHLYFLSTYFAKDYIVSQVKITKKLDASVPYRTIFPMTKNHGSWHPPPRNWIT